jgi:hypothetical protein
VTETPADWILPDFIMSTYDGDVVSWRLMLQHSYISGEESSIAGGDSWYVYQTMPQLPTQWNMTYDAPSGQVEVFVYGHAGTCGQSEQEDGPAFENPSNLTGDGDINRLRG